MKAKSKRPPKFTGWEDVICEYLKRYGYDGLVSEDRECGCIIGDLFPCDAVFENCLPAYNHTTDSHPKFPCFRMQTNKPRKKRKA